MFKKSDFAGSVQILVNIWFG